MRVKDLAATELFQAVTLPQGDREIDGVYIGDLLSWVMGRAECNNAWITIMSNINVIAVATLVDVSCVILAEGVAPDDEFIKTANSKGVNVLSTDLPIYGAAVRLANTI